MITPVDDQSYRAIDTMDANMLAELLQQVLESSRYFIVLDDIPDIVTWRALKYVFPVENCGSRVIIILRFDNMCHTICEDILDNDVYSLNPLSEYESWVLFRTRITSCSTSVSNRQRHRKKMQWFTTDDSSHCCSGGARHFMKGVQNLKK
ncbi:hypothetical protein KY290_007035 [Solanum tuberosum]|uniref:NB-ARC domain-containing protein n=1 Tax=Solanum tuberosum TaxID=4113 RepID=A0ABQ7W4E7_SOLTU|nr:hypothetical protein KY290_007035 [Solanum tuberosum]